MEKINDIKTGNFPTNYLFEGDNLKLLKGMQGKYKNSIGVIYIDPPYNTGLQFTYKDNSHGDWLQFMRERLELAKELLNENGVIYVSIGQKEQAYLKVLMDEIFGRDNFITQFIWVSTKQSLDENVPLKTLGSNVNNFKDSYEFILSYRKSNKFKYGLIKSNEKTLETRITKRNNATSIVNIRKGIRCEADNIVYTNTVGGNREPIKILNEEGIIVKEGILQNDITLEAQFAIPQMMEKLYNGETVYDSKGQLIKEVYLKKSGIPYLIKEKKGEVVNNVLTGFGGTSIWKGHLENMFHREDIFDYPKPYPLIQLLIELHPSKDVTVLDFFAGSGTTGQAVMELNKQDGGNRKYILCTMNEISDRIVSKYLFNQGKITKNSLKELGKFKKEHADEYTMIMEREELGIVRQITYPRLEKVIKGYTGKNGEVVEGIPSNLEHYKLP